MALAQIEERRRPAVVEIEPGRYDEALRVRGEVRLVALGEPGSVRVGTLDADGDVRVEGLAFVGRETDVVACRAGRLTLGRVEIRAHSGVAVHAWPGTVVNVQDSTVLHGRMLYDGAYGIVERCRFGEAADNAVAAIRGAELALRDSRIEGSRIHGVRVSGARASVQGCVVTGTGGAAVVADTQGELTLADCRIDAVQAEGVMFIEQSRGTVDRVRVTDARHGIAVMTGARPVVRGSEFVDCRDTGINVQSAGRGMFDGCEVRGAGNVAVFAHEGGAPELSDCRVVGGNVGIAVIGAARGRFTRTGIEDLTGVALRVHDEGGAVFDHVRVERCQSGLETRGNAGTTAEVTGAEFRDIDNAAVEVAGQSRVTVRGATVERAQLGYCVGEDGQLFAYDCSARAITHAGAVALGKGRLVARDLTVHGSGAFGLYGTDNSQLDVSKAVFADCDKAGACYDGTSRGRLTDCAVTGTRGIGVQHNGLVSLVSLDTSLPVVHKDIPPTPSPTTVHHHYEGPYFAEGAHGIQLAWNNGHVTQHQTNQNQNQTNQDGSST
uniref:right-handed parallel beta-helix repeat-containing protein n=1 Tax=Streptomyces corallincola TaxID=2851888 RepID=UPI0027E22AA9|nr:right-handed parallel beta-helix repeat-containing protein [Streptomyces corallincola]